MSEGPVENREQSPVAFVSPVSSTQALVPQGVVKEVEVKEGVDVKDKEEEEDEGPREQPLSSEPPRPVPPMLGASRKKSSQRLIGPYFVLVCGADFFFLNFLRFSSLSSLSSLIDFL